MSDALGSSGQYSDSTISYRQRHTLQIFVSKEWSQEMDLTLQPSIITYTAAIKSFGIWYVVPTGDTCWIPSEESCKRGSSFLIGGAMPATLLTTWSFPTAASFRAMVKTSSTEVPCNTSSSTPGFVETHGPTSCSTGHSCSAGIWCCLFDQTTPDIYIWGRLALHAPWLQG